MTSFHHSLNRSNHFLLSKLFSLYTAPEIAIANALVKTLTIIIFDDQYSWFSGYVVIPQHKIVVVIAYRSLDVQLDGDSSVDLRVA